MSKSKGNVVNPDEYIKKFGADALRMYLMFLAPFEQGGDFRDAGILGVTRFLDRVWKMGQRVLANKNTRSEELVVRALHKTIKKVTEDIASLQYNTAVSALMMFVNEAESKKIGKKDFEALLKLIAPYSPHITEELWRELGNKKSIHRASWPKCNIAYIKEDTFDLIIQVNGKLRGRVKTSVNVTEEEAKTIASEDVTVREFLKGKKIEKVIYVENRLINFVIRA